MPDFSLELNEDQLQIQKWVHDFAENVVRPAAHEWDEREETPWPIIEEAAKVGLYSIDFVANAFGDPTGLMIPIVMEEMCWGDAGIALAIFGTTLGVAGLLANGTPDQVAEWMPQCFGTPDKIQIAAFGVSEPDAGSDVPSLGIRASHTAEVVLEDCRVPGRCLLGGKEKLDARLARAREGKSSKVQAAMATFESTRPAVGAQAIGIARAAYEFALDYAKERRQF